MPKLYFGEAFGLIGKTMPFIWARLGSYLLLGLGLAIYFGVMGGIAVLLARLWGVLGLIFFAVTVIGAFGIVRWVTRYYFYLLKAAHTSVMTEFIVHGQGPDGSQIEYGKRQVTDRFGQTSAMFAVDVLVDGIVKAFVRSFVRVASILPIPGLSSLGNILERVAVMSSTYVDESILSRAYKERSQNVWKVAHEGVILYAQAWKPIVANAVALALLSYVEFVVLIVILALPAFAIGAVLPVPGWFLGITVLLAAWMIKLAVADAFSLAATLIAYHRATEGLEPDPTWMTKLEGVSDKFRELGQKAAAATQGGDAGEGAGADDGGADGGTAAAEPARERRDDDDDTEGPRVPPPSGEPA